MTARVSEKMTIEKAKVLAGLLNKYDCAKRELTDIENVLSQKTFPKFCQVDGRVGEHRFNIYPYASDVVALLTVTKAKLEIEIAEHKSKIEEL